MALCLLIYGSLICHDLLNGFIEFPRLLALLGIKVLTTYFSRINDLFVIPFYRKSYGADSFFFHVPYY